MSDEEIEAIEWIKAQRGKYYKIVIDLLSKKDKEYTELYDELTAEKQLNVKRLDISNRLREAINLMAEDMATDYHSKEWVINYYMEKINEFRGSN